MHVFVPFDASEPKTRLSSVLDRAERREFATVMLDSVVETIEASGHDAKVLATAPIDCEAAVTVDGRPLTPAVNDVLSDAPMPAGVVMADLPLLSVRSLERLFGAAGDVVIAPGVGGGTNALVVDHDEFRVDFHGVSYEDHREIAQQCGASLTTVDSFRLALDVDEPADLGEVLLHDTGQVADWLVEHGFEIDGSDGRMTVERP